MLLNPRFQLTGFHAGELEAQRRAGELAQQKAQQISSLFSTRPISEQLQAFFGDLTLLYTAVRGQNGRLWASVLYGQQKFIQIPNPYQAIVSPLQQFQGDPASYIAGHSIGTVGVMLQNRRRNLINGIISSSDGGHLQFDVYQAFGNCPKYIQVRHLEQQAPLLANEHGKQSTTVLQGCGQLQPAQLSLVARADTFFLASAHQASLQQLGGPKECKLNHINHRGGYPGFVQADPSGRLVWAEYAGNNVMSTTGNLLLDPEAALLFIDFTTGDTLHLSGHAEVLWDKTELPGAQCTVAFWTEEWVHVKGALPFSQKGPVESSPYIPNPTTSQAASVQHLRCVSTKQESTDVMTFEFEVPDLPANRTFCKAGQFASFDFEEIVPGEVVNRTWTISSSVEQIKQRGTFTVSIKKDGLVSNWMFDNMVPGKNIDFKGVDGTFTLELAGSIEHSRVLLVAGGIGITPMRVLLAERLAKQQPVLLLYFVRTLTEAPFLDELVQAAQQSGGVFTLAVSVTRPTHDDSPRPTGAEPPDVTWLQGRINPEMVSKILPDIKSCVVFQCGPTPMMQLVTDTMKSMHLPESLVFQEAFNF